MSLQCIIFKVANKRYCVDIAKVSGVHEMLEITEIPNAPSYLDGIVNLRGTIIPIINIHDIFKYPRAPISGTSRIVNINIDGVVVGFLVDEIMQVTTIADDMIDNPPALISGKEKAYISKVAKLKDSIAIILDMDKIFKEEQKEFIINIAE